MEEKILTIEEVQAILRIGKNQAYKNRLLQVKSAILGIKTADKLNFFQKDAFFY